jgi:molybdopterin-containing oxidoreductase family iron-sulfur binding subunit
VCPVLATYHTIDGLNAMVYNRCAGTRYCANACPYKARRFNYHTYVWPEPFNLQLNPEVSTRTMGVMEKCTFCVQRIRSTQSAYRDMGFTNLVPDEALENLPACVEACPSQAMTFGNLVDPESKVTKLRKSARSYEMLADLNVMSAVNYLSRATFHPPKVAHGSGHGDGGHTDDGHHESNDAKHGAAAPSDKNETHDAAPAAGH